MESDELKKRLISLIGQCIDEESIPGVNSFVEMDFCTIHYAGDGGERYFKITLEEVDEDEYWKPYQPQQDVPH